MASSIESWREIRAKLSSFDVCVYKGGNFVQSAFVVGVALAAISSATLAFLALDGTGPLRNLAEGAKIAIGVGGIVLFLGMIKWMGRGFDRITAEMWELVALEDYGMNPSMKLTAFDEGGLVETTSHGNGWQSATDIPWQLVSDGKAGMRERRRDMRLGMLVLGMGALLVTISLMIKEGTLPQDAFPNDMVDHMLYSGIAISGLGVIAVGYMVRKYWLENQNWSLGIKETL